MSPCAYLLATTCSEAVGVQHSISPSSHDSMRLCASAFVWYTRTHFIFYFRLVLLRSLLSVKLVLAIICRHVVGLELMNNDAGASRRGIKVGAAGAAAKSERII